MAQEMMNCPFCGALISTESTFCPYCGQKIAKPAAPQQPDPAVEEAARRQREQEEAARRQREQEEAARRQREQEEAARRQQEEAARLQREQEEAARRQQEEAARLQREQEEAAARQRAYEQQQANQQQAYQQLYDQAGPQGPGVPPVPPFPPTSGGSSDFSVMSILTEGIPLGIANFVTIFGATILWLLTFWIPYLNVGTTIALNTMPIALADNEAPEGPTYIFKDKYRKYMGEYFVLMGLMYMAIWMASVFLIIPGIVISLAWSQALYLLFDKHLTPMDAMKESNEKTYGHKWTIFFTGLVFAIAFGIFAMIVLWLFITIDVMFLTVIAVLLLIALAMVGSVGINAVIYRKLCK
jgi:flagellar biosynthesis GTPase FlhF